MIRLLLTAWLALALVPAHADTCGDRGVWLQVLGSGGPQAQGGRAGSSYLVWIDGKARVLVDAGGGAALRFGESGASFADLDVILLTHLHADHTSDLPALIQASLFDRRKNPLPLFGPDGNRVMPSTVAFVRTLFDPTRGAYRYLSEVLTPQDTDGYKLRPRDTETTKARDVVTVFANERVQATAAPVVHGNIPTLAWRVNAGGRSVVFMSDAPANNKLLAKLTAGADLVVADHAVPEDATGAELALYMRPSGIAQIAHSAGARRLVLSHWTARTQGREIETTSTIRKTYTGQLDFANDLSCFKP